MAVKVTSYVWNLIEATADEPYKICHVAVLKKASAIVCVFYEKRRLENTFSDQIFMYFAQHPIRIFEENHRNS